MQFAQLLTLQKLPLLRYPAFALNSVMGFMFLKRNIEQTQVHHRNSIKWDNTAANLMWVTSSENLHFAVGYPTKVQIIVEQEIT